MPSNLARWTAELERATERAPLQAWKRRWAVCDPGSALEMEAWLHALVRHGLGGDGHAPERLAWLSRQGWLTPLWGMALPHWSAFERTLLGQIIADRRVGPGQVDRWAPWIEAGWAATTPTLPHLLAQWRHLVTSSLDERLPTCLVYRFPEVLNQAAAHSIGTSHWSQVVPLRERTQAWAWALAHGMDPDALSLGRPNWQHALQGGLSEVRTWARSHRPEAWQAYDDQRFCERLAASGQWATTAQAQCDELWSTWLTYPRAAQARDSEGRPALWHAVRHAPTLPLDDRFSDLLAHYPAHGAPSLTPAWAAGWLEAHASSHRQAVGPQDALARLAPAVPGPGVFLLTPKPYPAAQAQWASWAFPAAFWWGGTDAAWATWLQKVPDATTAQTWSNLLTEGPFSPDQVHPFLRGLVVAFHPSAEAWHVGASWPIEHPWPQWMPEEAQIRLQAQVRAHHLHRRPAGNTRARPRA